MLPLYKELQLLQADISLAKKELIFLPKTELKDRIKNLIE